MVSAAAKRTRTRQAFYAFLFSLIVPGTGQAYVGAWRQGLTIFAGLLGIHVLGGFLQSTFLGLVVALCTYGVVHLLAAIDAVRQARRREPWSFFITKPVLLAFLAGISILRFAPFGAAAGTEFYEIIQPTLRPGELVMTQRTASVRLARGDVTVFEVGQDPHVSRVIGVPGDRIEIRGGVLHLNGSPVLRTVIDQPAGSQTGGISYRETLPDGRVHLIREVGDNEFGDNTREFVVPDDHVFVLGDNRDEARDSRWIGPIPFDRVLGRGLYLFSEDLDRLGQPL